jgi:hypothetical protein
VIGPRAWLAELPATDLFVALKFRDLVDGSPTTGWTPTG